ncbi:MAG: tetratricopeptide repeat protein [Rickettsiales bacterium]|jgi:tetratricopeptide (TPR) repeat protein|nr:tetratricopeptide repeat protein [Rickettsiales bacterium]
MAIKKQPPKTKGDDFREWVSDHSVILLKKQRKSAAAKFKELKLRRKFIKDKKEAFVENDAHWGQWWRLYEEYGDIRPKDRKEELKFRRAYIKDNETFFLEDDAQWGVWWVDYKKYHGIRPKDRKEEMKLRRARVSAAAVKAPWFALWQMISWLATHATMNNFVIKGMEKKFAGMKKPSRGKNFLHTALKVPKALAKKFPSANAYFYYYILWLASLASYDNNVFGVKDKTIQGVEWVWNKIGWGEEDGKTTPGIKEILEFNKDAFNAQAEKLKDVVLIPIVNGEFYRSVPKVQPGENVWTHGYGMTWSRDKNGNMKIRDYADTQANRKRGYVPHKPKTGNTKQQDLEESQNFIKTHVNPEIRRSMARAMSDIEYLAVVRAGYQLEGHITEICKNLSEAKNSQQIADAFITKGFERYGGTPKVRWLCGALAAGLITVEDIANMDLDAIYKIDDYTLCEKNKDEKILSFIIGKQTIDYVLQKTAGKGTRNELNQSQLGRKALENIKKIGAAGPHSEEIGSMPLRFQDVALNLLVRGNIEYKNKNYAAAEDFFKQAVAQDPKNPDAYNDLAITLIRLGKYQEAIEACKKVLEIGDREKYSPANFNAGIAYEKLGNLERAALNYKAAVDNNSDVEAYKNALDRVNAQIKKQKFENGKLKVKVRQNTQINKNNGGR